MISKETKRKINDNNIQISKLLRENEEMLKNEGINIPVDNYVPEKDNKIAIPSGYIRTVETFYKKYHLDKIVARKETRRNMSYALQLSDLYNYYINRFNIWGSVEAMLIKSAIINFISIFEVLVYECANNICHNAAACRKIKDCKYHFSNKERNNSIYEALLKMQRLNITEFTEDEMTTIQQIIQLRNNVHIRLANVNEYTESKFSLDEYNNLVCLLQKLCDQIYKNGVSLYRKECCTEGKECNELQKSI